MSHRVWSFMAFKPNELGHDQNHSIVCSNNPILCKVFQHFECPKFSIYLSWKIQTSTKSAWNGSKFNYKCLIVFSGFFSKIIFSFTSRYFIIDPIIFLQDSTPSYEGACPLFWPHFDSSRGNSKKSKKNETFALFHVMWPTC
jgi:hypothetical protein